MNERDYLQVALFLGGLIALTPPLGRWMAAVFAGEKIFLTPVLGGLEALIYRLSGIDARREMNWKRYLAVILVSTAIGCVTKAGVSSIANQGPHGFSEILYAFTSAVVNNGSAFAGLNANTDFYNYLTALAMFIGRFAIIVAVLAIAGSLAPKKSAPPSAGTFPTDSFTFAALLMAVVLIVGALTFFPALSLGPIVEHLLMQAGRTF